MPINMADFEEKIKKLHYNLRKIVDENTPEELSKSTEFMLAGKELQEFLHQYGIGAHIGVSGKGIKIVIYPLDNELKETDTEIGMFSKSLGITQNPN